jgi:putative PIN family toxin of toxin-antitoxin system
MIRIVIDTNVYISALMFGGLPGSLLDLVFLRCFVTLVSPDLLRELDEKLKLKFKVSSEDAATILEKITGAAEVVQPKETLHVVNRLPDGQMETRDQGSAKTISCIGVIVRSWFVGLTERDSEDHHWSRNIIFR